MSEQNTTAVNRPVETVGRKFSGVRFEVHSRPVGKNRWFSGGMYDTQADAQKAIDKAGEPDPVDEIIGRSTALYEYRIVRREYDCTVVHVENKRI